MPVPPDHFLNSTSLEKVVRAAKQSDNPAVFREIAKDIRQAAIDYHAGRERFYCTTRHGLKVSCKNTPEAIKNMAGRYEKAAKRKPMPTTVIKHKPFYVQKTRSLNQFIKDGEIENAIAFANLHNRPIYFYRSCSKSFSGYQLLSSVQLLEDKHFVIGQIAVSSGIWEVIHLDSGLSNAHSYCKKKALEHHTSALKNRSSEINAFLAKHACDFQAKAQRFFTTPNEDAVNPRSIARRNQYVIRSTNRSTYRRTEA